MAIPKIKSGVRLREEEFGALVFTNRTPILALNADAVAAWNLINGYRDVESIVQEIAGQHQDGKQASELVEEFIASCVELDLIELSIHPGPESGT